MNQCVDVLRMKQELDCVSTSLPFCQMFLWHIEINLQAFHVSADFIDEYIKFMQRVNIFSVDSCF